MNYRSPLQSNLSNLPPGGGFYKGPEKAPQACSEGHKWEAPMFFELGGWFYCDEDKGPVCPECGRQDILGEPCITWLCDMFEADNPQFDRKKFWEACFKEAGDG